MHTFNRGSSNEAFTSRGQYAGENNTVTTKSQQLI